MEAERDIPLATACCTAAFCAVVAAIYSLVNVEPSPIVAVFILVAPAVTVLVWLQRDAQRQHLFVHDWGLFMWIWWPVLLPYYAFKTRGRRGWLLLLGLAALAMAPWLAANCVAILRDAARR